VSKYFLNELKMSEYYVKCEGCGQIIKAMEAGLDGRCKDCSGLRRDRMAPIGPPLVLPTGPLQYFFYRLDTKDDDTQGIAVGKDPKEAFDGMIKEVEKEFKGQWIEVLEFKRL